MTENHYTFYKTETYDKEHNHFGGTVYESDFRYASVSDIAQRIASDLRWEASLKKRMISEENYKKKGDK